jgi:sugar-specific transcriptional regulator TrmB
LYFFHVFQVISLAELILENQQTWREENSDLKESLETIKKDMENMEET